jgi:cell division protease FtsH
MDKKPFTAYHEAGHALLALSLDNAYPLLNATIVPHGKTLGRITQLAEREQQSLSLAQIKARMTIIMGGRVAEEIIFGKEMATTGANADIGQAIKMAHVMVERWGMNKESGSDEIQTLNVSDKTARRTDAEIRRLVSEADAAARSALLNMTAELHIIAQGLLRYESLSGAEIRGLLNGKQPSPSKAENALNSDEPTNRVPTTSHKYLLLAGG